jgi:RHH-type proline utilization regulon transcriptional repressor/proline dehydrogenase/delta 1-pyrroline-5-carboxylate dehydrogenase
MNQQQTDFNELYSLFLHYPFSDELAESFLANEDDVVTHLLSEYDRHYSFHEIATLAKELIQFSRDNHSPVGLELLLQEYPLNTNEGLVLMNLAEALLRIPDEATALLLTKEQFNLGQWIEHIAKNESWFVNLSTWGVLFSKKLLSASEHLQESSAGNLLASMTSRLGEKSIVSAVHFAANLLSKQFVIGESIKEALVNSQSLISDGYCFSYDMLGEEAMTEQEAERYYQRYRQAILHLAETGAAREYSASISIKLSALHPRFEYRQKEHVYSALFERLMQLCLLAKIHDIAITIDAEEAAQLEMTLVLLQMLFAQVELKGWNQLGIAVQAYQKRAPLVIEHLVSLAQSYEKIIPVRLVKGAYWDHEIKAAQQKGLRDFPVFTEKVNTELCYLYCIEKLFTNKQYFFPQFATHNSQTIASVYYYARKYNVQDFEFQRLFGMGSMVYDGLSSLAETIGVRKIPCRIYAPVGEQKTLLSYLVRRLLENGANNSFINQLYNQSIEPDDLIINIRDELGKKEHYRNSKVKLAGSLFSQRLNSQGVNLDSSYEILQTLEHLMPFLNKQWQASSMLAFDIEQPRSEAVEQYNPATGQGIGRSVYASEADCLRAIEQAQLSFEQAQDETLTDRIETFRKLAELFEYNRSELMALLINEAGKTIADAIDEIRECIDFCRYYAHCAEKAFTEPHEFESYTGEDNHLIREGRGVILCISPWNFPLSIFVGQITAALLAGNSVLAKPASATPLIAAKAVELMHLAGVSPARLQLLLAPAERIERTLLSHSALAGVSFTGSFEAARKINQLLAARPGGIIPFIAETGGVNVMLADSSALSEQLVKDVLDSAFGNAGQRCSALRVLFLQEEMYQTVFQLLTGAVQELNIADPVLVSTDVGPLINHQAASSVRQYIEKMRDKGFKVFQGGRINKSIAENNEQFVLPTVIEVNSLDEVPQEIFGPVLHLISYQANNLESVLYQINHTGYGLTFGIHSRIPSRMEKLAHGSFSGNVYVNRNMVGAVVGVQPFGGQGMSGTGPKAGGPDYVKRFTREKVISVNTACIGGNIKLFTDL